YNLTVTNFKALLSNSSYTNETEYTLSYGKGYMLQLLNDGNWNDIPTLPGVGWKDIALNLEAGKSFEEVIDLKLLYGELKTGHYRIIKEMFTETSELDVIVEFEL
ncbi:immunoglobulin-like domain-containing protein, partial [Desulfitobacterium hafniense]|uniref:immunoglobulin-like domain-containing protein n=1 Tax=Desulfitobacterium hafniense TaxID=49338 RepID=UPI000A62C604